jgi:hypothetical protein
MMRAILGFVMVCAVTVALAQTPSSQYQNASIVKMAEHQESVTAKSGEAPPVRYDVSLRVKDTVYVVLFTPPPGTYGAQYMTGMDLLVLVEEKTVTFNDMLGRSFTAPIISQAPAQPRANP